MAYILAPEATFFPPSVAEGNFGFLYMPLVIDSFRVQGSVVAPRTIYDKILNSVAVYNIKPTIEKLPLDKEGIDDAFKHLDHNELRYRGVLVAQDQRRHIDATTHKTTKHSHVYRSDDWKIPTKASLYLMRTSVSRTHHVVTGDLFFRLPPPSQRFVKERVQSTP